MMNLLVADDNVFFATNVTNIILEQNTDLHLVKICTDGKDTLNLLKTKKIDILLLDLNMPICNGFEILDFIKNSNLHNSISIIVMSGDSFMTPKMLNSSYIHHFLIKGTLNFAEKLNQLIFEIIINNKCTNIKKQVLSDLRNIGFNITHSGTHYLLESIFLVYNSNNKKLLNNLEKNVYPTIAKMYNKNLFTVKSSITKSIDSMYNMASTSQIQEYFLISDNTKPTSKVIIHSIIDKLILE